VIWVGTDDGNIQLTRDGGKSWTSVGKKLPSVPPAIGVTCVEASHFDEGTAYATLDGHGVGDMKSYVLKTTDFGKTWQSLATPDLRGYAHVVREDLVKPELLFLGTEAGLFFSVDGGAQWAAIKGEFPPVAVRDLSIHPRDHDLLVATHGRGIWILDDLTPLRGLTREVMSTDAAFLPSRPSVEMIPSSEQSFDASEYTGRVPEEAAMISYYLKKRHIFGELKLEVYDAQGQLISTLPGGKRRGINRVAWPMRLKAPKVPPSGNLVPLGFAIFGPRLPEGAYTVKLLRGKDTLSSTVTLAPDPRSRHTAEDRAVQQKTVLQLYRDLADLSFVVDAVVDARNQLRGRAEKAGATSALGKRLIALADKLEARRQTLLATREGGQLAGEEQLREKLGALYGAVNGYDGRPTNGQLRFMEFLEGQVADARTWFDGIATKDLPGLNTGLAGQKLDPIKVVTREEWEKRSSAQAKSGGTETVEATDDD
jgi:hypothetical protein